MTTNPTIDEILGDSSTASVERERRFFHSLKLSNGTKKLTYANRFDDINPIVLPHIPKRKSPIEIMDVAASSGITSLEWSEHLQENNIDHRMIVGDVSAMGWRIDAPFGTVLLQRDGFPLQFDVAGRGFPNATHSRQERLKIEVLKGAFKAWLALNPRVGAAIESGQELAGKRFTLRQQPLVSGRVLASDLHVTTDDFLASNRPEWKQKFHVIRAGNILFPSYFSEHELLRIIDNLRERLKRNGVLIICKTELDSEQNGTVFRKVSNEKFKLLEKIGGGSIIDPLVLGIHNS